MRKTNTVLILAILTLFTYLYATKQCIWTGIEKIVAVGDLHGDYENFLKILKGTKLIDNDDHWTGGKTHLVQVGDVIDKGLDAKRIYDLLKKLEKEAEEAGGKIHMLIGNHEMMNIAGIAFDWEDYIQVEQFVSFLPDEYREKREKKIKKKTGENTPKMTESDSSLDSDLKAYWKEVLREAKRKNTHRARREYTKNFNKKYGKWIIEHNAVIKINDIIFVHGGISKEFSKWKLKEINDRVRMELNNILKGIFLERNITFDPRGPLWYRDLAQIAEEDLKEDVDRILDNLKAQYMVIGHTPIRIIDEDHMKRFDGRIWIIDTGISKVYGGYLSALIIENGKFTVWPPDLRRKEFVSIKYIRQFQGMNWIAYPGIANVIASTLSKLIIDNKNFFVWGINNEN